MVLQIAIGTGFDERACDLCGVGRHVALGNHPHEGRVSLRVAGIDLCACVEKRSGSCVGSGPHERRVARAVPGVHVGAVFDQLQYSRLVVATDSGNELVASLVKLTFQDTSIRRRTFRLFVRTNGS